ncbi:hypothetical protein DXG01_010455, partial [Tephrocybe rancida]
QDQEYTIYKKLLDICSGLKENLLQEATSPEDLLRYADGDHYFTQIQKGTSSARGNDTKGMKPAIIEMITPHGKSLHPPLHRRQKVDRGFNHDATGQLLCPAHLDWADKKIREGLQTGELIVPGHSWPMFLYENYIFND